MPPAANAGGQPPGRPPGGVKTSSQFQPTKDLVFNVTVPADASTVSVIDAVADVVGLPNVYMVQHLGGAKFQCTVYTSAAMQQLLRHGGLSICGKTVAIEALAPRLTRVACLSLPGYVTDEHLLRALAPYGKVVGIERPTTVDRPTVKNGHRVVQIEMKPEKPVPNFIRVLEHRVICDYPGVLRVCSRCKKAGHYRKDCKEDFCGRCSTFGHTTGSCTAKCRRCRGDHATADCVKPRSFAEVLAGRERRERSAAMEQDGGSDGNTLMGQDGDSEGTTLTEQDGGSEGSTLTSRAASAAEPTAPPESEASQDDSRTKELPPTHVTPTDALQATTAERNPTSEGSSCGSPRPLVIVEDEFCMETNQEEEFHHSKTDGVKDDEFMDSDCSVSSGEVKAARNEIRREHQAKRMKKEESRQSSDDEDT